MRLFVVSPDALEVMWITQWWYLLKTWLMLLQEVEDGEEGDADDEDDEDDEDD